MVMVADIICMVKMEQQQTESFVFSFQDCHNLIHLTVLNLPRFANNYEGGAVLGTDFRHLTIMREAKWISFSMKMDWRFSL